MVYGDELQKHEQPISPLEQHTDGQRPPRPPASRLVQTVSAWSW